MLAKITVFEKAIPAENMQVESGQQTIMAGSTFMLMYGCFCTFAARSFPS